MFHPSVLAFSCVPDNVCHTTLFLDPVCTLSVLADDSYHNSLHLPLGCDILTVEFVASEAAQMFIGLHKSGSELKQTSGQSKLPHLCRVTQIFTALEHQFLPAW